MITHPTFVTLVALGLFGLLSVACEHDHDQEHSTEDEDHHETGTPHHGQLVDLGSAGHVEIVHEHEAGTVTLHFTGPDAEAALAVDSAPEIKLMTNDGPRVLTTQASEGSSSTFVVTDEALHAESLDGRLSVVIGGQTFQPDLHHDH